MLLPTKQNYTIYKPYTIWGLARKPRKTNPPSQATADQSIKAATHPSNHRPAKAGDGSTPARAGAGKRNPPKGGSIRRRHSDVASGAPAKTRRARAGETPGQAPAARLTGRAPSSQPPCLHASLRPSYADAPATRAMTIPCVRGADTTREPTWRSGLRVGRVARANVTRPVKESATT